MLHYYAYKLAITPRIRTLHAVAKCEYTLYKTVGYCTVCRFIDSECDLECKIDKVSCEFCMV